MQINPNFINVNEIRYLTEITIRSFVIFPRISFNIKWRIVLPFFNVKRNSEILKTTIHSMAMPRYLKNFSLIFFLNVYLILRAILHPKSKSYGKIISIFYLCKNFITFKRFFKEKAKFKKGVSSQYKLISYYEKGCLLYIRERFSQILRIRFAQLDR